jgi:SAM-dependent methyltransferase
MPLAEPTETRRDVVDKGRLRRIGKALADALVRPLAAEQGVHVDPLAADAPDPRLWSQDQQSAWFSDEMKLFCECLRYDGMDVRSSILDDLSRYYRLSPQECLHRCLHWERWSVDEWRAKDRSTHEGLQDFYSSVQSWSFDLLWFAYLQAFGFGFPASVAAARFARTKCPGGSHLDFGSGVGVTSQLFHRLGFASTCADVSDTLLAFAQWRIERHGDRAGAHDLKSGSLANEHYDVVTAIDALTHVSDFDATAAMLHRAIRPGGWLLANFDVRKSGSDESAWHLYDDALDLEYRLQRTGFVRCGELAGMLRCYERVDPSTVAHRLRTFRDRLWLKPPLGTLVATSRRIKWPTPRRLRRLARLVTKST